MTESASFKKWEFLIHVINFRERIYMNCENEYQRITQDIRNKKDESIIETSYKWEDVIHYSESKNPRIIYYINKISIASKRNGNNLITFKYANLETPMQNVYVILTEEQFVSLFKYEIGSFKANAVVTVKNNVDLDRAIDTLYKKYYSFFPSFKNLHFSSVPGYSHYFSSYRVDMEYKIGKVKLRMMDKEIDDEVEHLARILFDRNMPDYVKAYIAHNYIALNVKYYLPDNRSKLMERYIHSAYGALINKLCVCQGYAEAYKRLLDKCGVKCEMVHGQIKGSSEYHAWNIIGIGSKFYHVDTTWDAGDKVEYTYFCKSDSFMSPKRTWYNDYMPRCNYNEDILSVAKRYVSDNRNEMINRGLNRLILDCN